MTVVFYRTEAGHEPVRERLAGLSREVRSEIEPGIARVIFTVEGTTLVLLHAFVKKSLARQSDGMPSRVPSPLNCDAGSSPTAVPSVWRANQDFLAHEFAEYP